MSRLSLTLFLIAGALRGQTIQGIPKEAEILETKALPKVLRPGRALVLWMLSPEEHPVDSFLRDQYTCPTYTRAPFKRGQTRISLVDTSAMRVMNSVPVQYGEDDEFDLPLEAELITLGDIDGDGVAAELFLLDKPSCGNADTYVFGYNAMKDRVVHYYFQLTDTEGKRVRRTSLQSFHLQKATSPRHWNFKVVDDTGDERVYDIRFLPQRERFEGTMDSKRSANLRK
jgi:hypothetical protein